MSRAAKAAPRPVGRPSLGKAARTNAVIVKMSDTELAAIKRKVAAENAEAKRDGSDEPITTVSSWIREHALEPLGLATAGEGD